MASEQQKHTPGRLTVESATSEAMHDLAIEGADTPPEWGYPVVVATMASDSEDDGGDGYPISVREAEANARRLALCWNCHDELLAACRPVLLEARQRAADYLHDTWNPDAHVELTLTIAELRAIHAAIAKAEGKAAPDEH